MACHAAETRVADRGARLATTHRWPMLGFGLCVVISLTGCQSLLKGDRSRTVSGSIDQENLRLAGGAEVASAAAGFSGTLADGTPAIIMEIRAGKSHLEKIPLPSERPFFVEDLVREAKLVDRLGRIDVTISRPVVGQVRPLRMTAKLDAAGKQILPGQNYALHAGDHVLITHGESPMVSDIKSAIPFLGR
jgi:hypothetical protein